MAGRNEQKIEKAENFSLALKRLLKEMKGFNGIVVIAMLCAIISAVLSISAPNRLTSLTDEITEGIKINSNNLNVIMERVQTGDFSDLSVDGTIIKSNELINFAQDLSEVTKENQSNIYDVIEKSPNSIQAVLKPKLDIKTIKTLSIILLFIYLFSALFDFTEGIIMTTVANKFAQRLRSGISKKINLLPLKYFDNHITGDILSRVTNDIDTIAQNLNNSLSTFVSSLTLFLGSIIMMFATNWIMAVTAILSSLIGFIFMFIILAKSQKYFVLRQKELGRLNGHIEEVYASLNVVKAYNGKEFEDKKFDKYNDLVCHSNEKSQFLSGLMHPIMGFIGNLSYVAVCIVGALLTMNNVISFGVIVAFMIYIRLFTGPLSRIAQSMTAFQTTAAASERVFEFLDEENMPKETVKAKLDIENVKGKIEFKNVSFTYDGNEKETIKNFNASIKPGQKIAIVGPTGAGKTTLVNLLMKFYDINAGDILIDGISIHDLSRENIHDLFTMVLQDTWLFDGSIKENIVYNRKNISENDIIDACNVVGLKHFIKTLPHGFDSYLTENESISAGQKQLLTIARGMIKNAPFIILDEATSNVDTRTEELVQNAMDKLTEGRTSFIIAHRLSTIKNADLILVMKDGDIIEKGNHEELMNKNGFYSQLYNSQFEL